MKYVEYLHIQSQMERMYDFHPAYFDMLSDEEKTALHEGFLYDVGDDSYPESIKDFYENRIAKNQLFQQKMFDAAQKIYTLSNSGSLGDDLKDIVSFKDESSLS